MRKRQKRVIDLLKRITRDMPQAGNQTLAAAVVKSNKIIAFGYNQRKTHPMQLRFARNEQSIYLHAEIDAIKNALKEVSVEDLSNCILYVVRTKKDFSEGLAKPCKGCKMAIATFGIKKVIYTTNEENVYGVQFIE